VFDLRDFLVYDQTLVSWTALALVTVYAAVWTGIFSSSRGLGFIGKNLTT